MTPDNEFFLVIGGAITGGSILILSFVWSILAERYDFFRRIRDD